MTVDYDEIGIWSEVKLAIIREYASAYSTILDAQRRQEIPPQRARRQRDTCPSCVEAGGERSLRQRQN